MTTEKTVETEKCDSCGREDCGCSECRYCSNGKPLCGRCETRRNVETTANYVSLLRPDLAAGDAIAVVLMSDPMLTAEEVIETLDQAAADYAADRTHDGE